MADPLFGLAHPAIKKREHTHKLEPAVGVSIQRMILKGVDLPLPVGLVIAQEDAAVGRQRNVVKRDDYVLPTTVFLNDVINLDNRVWHGLAGKL